MLLTAYSEKGASVWYLRAQKHREIGDTEALTTPSSGLHGPTVPGIASESRNRADAINRGQLCPLT